MLAYDYPLLGVFWSMLWFFLWFAWIILLFRVFGDIFRSPKRGIAKAFWVVFVVAVPVIGVLIYLIANGSKMTERDIEQARAQEAAFQSYVRDVVGSGGSTADELAKLADLHGRGAISDTEFAQLRAKALG